MKTIGNILWFVFGGFLLWLEWAAAGILLCVSIIGIPAGIQCLKIAKLAAFPFKKEVVYEDVRIGGTLLNIVWIFVFGWEIAVTAALCGILWCITVVGIPFGKQFFKFAKLGIMPFGAKVVRK